MGCEERAAALDDDPFDMTVSDSPSTPVDMLVSTDAGGPDSTLQKGLAFPPGPCEIQDFCVRGECVAGEPGLRLRFTYGENRLPIVIEGFYGREPYSVTRHRYDGNMLVATEMDHFTAALEFGVDGFFETVLFMIYDERQRVVELTRRQFDQGIQGMLEEVAAWRYGADGSVAEVVWTLTGFDGQVRRFRHRHDREGDILTIVADFGDDGSEDARSVYELDDLGRLLRATRSHEAGGAASQTTWLYYPPARVAAIVRPTQRGVEVGRLVYGPSGPAVHHFTYADGSDERASFERRMEWTHGTRGEITREYYRSPGGERQNERIADHACWTLGDERPGCGMCPVNRPVCREGVYCAECDPKDGRTCPLQRPLCIDGWCYQDGGSLNGEGLPALPARPYYWP